MANNLPHGGGRYIILFDPPCVLGAKPMKPIFTYLAVGWFLIVAIILGEVFFDLDLRKLLFERDIKSVPDALELQSKRAMALSEFSQRGDTLTVIFRNGFDSTDSCICVARCLE